MYNDNELLYLYFEHGDEDAYKCLIEKYKPLILKKIEVFEIENAKKSDYLQIGLEALNRAIKLYQENQKMSFNRFFDMLLERRFIDEYRKDKKDMLVFKNEIIDDLLDTNTLMEEKMLYLGEESLSNFEMQVFQKLYVEEKSILSVSKEFGCSRKTIYDALSRIKKKYFKK